MGVTQAPPHLVHPNPLEPQPQAGVAPWLWASNRRNEVASTIPVFYPLSLGMTGVDP